MAEQSFAGWRHLGQSVNQSINACALPKSMQVSSIGIAYTALPILYRQCLTPFFWMFGLIHSFGSRLLKAYTCIYMVTVRWSAFLQLITTLTRYSLGTQVKEENYEVAPILHF